MAHAVQDVAKGAEEAGGPRPDAAAVQRQPAVPRGGARPGRREGAGDGQRVGCWRCRCQNESGKKLPIRPVVREKIGIRTENRKAPPWGGPTHQPPKVSSR